MPKLEVIRNGCEDFGDEESLCHVYGMLVDFAPIYLATAILLTDLTIPELDG